MSNRYHIIEKLGEGGCGVVYKAFDNDLQTEIALKEMRNLSLEERYLLKREFRILRELSHRNLIEIYDLIETEDSCLITMQLIDGNHFNKAVWKADVFSGGAVYYDLLRNYFSQLVDGLHYLHQNNVVHLDIKPANVMVGKNSNVIILDFGLALRQRQGTINNDQNVPAGTPAYMSPEQIFGDNTISFASDWYSAGVVLYECLTGEIPPMIKGIEILEPRQIDSDIPNDLNDLTVSLLKYDPVSRPRGKQISCHIRALQDRSQRPAPIVASASGVFIGRHAELELLKEKQKDSLNLSSQVLFIQGDAGVGKSRLIEQFITEYCLNNQILTLTSQCHPFETIRFNALDQIVETLTGFLRSLPTDRLNKLIPSKYSLLTEFFPVFGKVEMQFQSEDIPVIYEPREKRKELVEVFKELLANIASEIPFSVFIDDFQWSDIDSVQILADLIANDCPGGLFILASRDDQKNTNLLKSILLDHEIGADKLTFLHLQELTENESFTLSKNLLGDSNASINQIIRESSGSPFLIEQFSRYFLEESSKEKPETGSLTVDDIFLRRLTRIPNEEREIMELAAIAGRPIDGELVLAVLNMEKRNLLKIRRLINRSLLRSVPSSRFFAVQLYHSRISDMVMKMLSLDKQKSYHLAFASTLERLPLENPGDLAYHYSAAEVFDKAARYAYLAAEQAEKQLAFHSAAEFYRKSIEWFPGDKGNQLNQLKKRAEALVNAGYCSEAGDVYFKAAGLARTDSAIRILKRLAAEQYMASGQIFKGEMHFRPLLRSYGIPFPKSPFTLTLGVLRMLLLVKTKNLEKSFKKSPSKRTPETAEMIDCCFAASKGLLMVESLKGIYLSLRSLKLTVQYNDECRIGKCLCEVGSMLIPSGGWLRKKGENMLSTAARFGKRLNDPYIKGMHDVCSAQTSMMQSRWMEMLERCDSGRKTLLEHCRGVSWELSIAQMAALRPLEELGRINELVIRSNALLFDSRKLGNFYGEAAAENMLSFWYHVKGDPIQASTKIATVNRLFESQSYNVLKLYAFRSELQCLLYESAYQTCMEKLERERKLIESSNLLKIAPFRLDMLLLEARILLRFILNELSTDKKIIGRLKRIIKQIQKEGRNDFYAHGLILLAGLQSLISSPVDAENLLTDSLKPLKILGMNLAVRSVELRLKQIRGLKLQTDDFHLFNELQFENGFKWLDFAVPMMPAP
ncbi:protein kinase [bacterium]|nr:protein kinase [bacterium]